jgi:predicted transcriptional regulator
MPRTRETQAEEELRIDFEILAVLLNPDVRGPLSVEEIVREMKNRAAVDDSLDRLYGAGLVHRWDEFVCPTQAARRFDAMTQ